MKKLLSLLVVSLLVCSFGVCRAEEDENLIITPKPIDRPLDVTPIAVKGTIAITEGWNLVAMPVLPVEPYTVRQFIKEVESPIRKIDEPLPYLGAEEKEEYTLIPIPLKPLIWKISVVAVYKNGRFERYPKEGVSYNMVPGEAYFVYARYDGPRCRIAYMIEEGTNPPYEPWRPTTSVKVIGRPLDVPVSLNLNRGWNGASILQKQLSLEESPYPRPIVLADNGDEAGDVVIGPVISGGASLNQLSQELVKQNIKATRIAFWSAENQEWVQFELPRPELKFDNPYEIIRTFDRFIRPDEGFFLLCEQNGLYIPFLNWNEKPPVPPFPPKPPFEERVSYTGKLDMVCGIPENMPPYEFAIFPYNEKKAISLMTTTDDVKAQLSAIYQAEDLCTVEGVMKHIRWGGYWPGESSHEEDVLMVNTVKKVYSMDPVMAELKAREYLAGLLGVDQGEITIVGSYDATIQKDGEIERRIVGVAIRVVTLKYNEREYLVKTTCAIYPGAEWGSFQVLLFL